MLRTLKYMGKLSFRTALLALVLIGGVFEVGCAQLKIPAEEAKAILKEASAAAAEAAVGTAMARVEEKISSVVPESIEVPVPKDDPLKDAVGFGALAAMYVLNQVRKGRLRKKELERVLGGEK